MCTLLSPLLQIWLYAVSVFLVFAVTLSLFPAVLSHIQSTSLDHEASQWTSKEQTLATLLIH